MRTTVRQKERKGTSTSVKKSKEGPLPYLTSSGWTDSPTQPPSLRANCVVVAFGV